jgi:hypothetical protein
MSHALAEILDKVRKLTPEDRKQLLAELQAQHAGQLFGKYSGVQTSSDAFCERKPGEVDLEDRSGPLHS